MCMCTYRYLFLNSFYEILLLFQLMFDTHNTHTHTHTHIYIYIYIYIYTHVYSSHDNPEHLSSEHNTIIVSLTTLI